MPPNGYCKIIVAHIRKIICLWADDEENDDLRLTTEIFFKVGNIFNTFQLVQTISSVTTNVDLTKMCFLLLEWVVKADNKMLVRDFIDH